MHRSHLKTAAGLAVTEAKEGIATEAVVVTGEGDGGEVG